MKRPKISKEMRSEVLELVRGKLEMRLKEKGDGSFASTHEILGVIDEEYNELRTAVHKNSWDDIVLELEDIAVAAIFSLACVRQQTVDW